MTPRQMVDASGGDIEIHPGLVAINVYAHVITKIREREGTPYERLTEALRQAIEAISHEC